MKVWSLLLGVVLLGACGGLEGGTDDAGPSTGGGGGAVASGGGAGGGGGGGGGATGGGGGASCDTWPAYGANFFATNCSNCHHHSGQFTTAVSVQYELSLIAAEIRAGVMPQGSLLSSSEQGRILAYLGCGAP